MLKVSVDDLHAPSSRLLGRKKWHGLFLQPAWPQSPLYIRCPCCPPNLWNSSLSSKMSPLTAQQTHSWTSTGCCKSILSPFCCHFTITWNQCIILGFYAKDQHKVLQNLEHNSSNISSHAIYPEFNLSWDFTKLTGCWSACSDLNHSAVDLVLYSDT